MRNTQWGRQRTNNQTSGEVNYRARRKRKQGRKKGSDYLPIRAKGLGDAMSGRGVEIRHVGKRVRGVDCQSGREERASRKRETFIVQLGWRHLGGAISEEANKLKSELPTREEWKLLTAEKRGSR